jgi:N-acetylneuraminic acid mutarotase
MTFKPGKKSSNFYAHKLFQNMKNLYVILTAILLCVIAGTSFAQNGWEQIADMPQATSWYGSCIDTVNEKAYFFGGQAPSPSDALSLLSTTQIYDFKTGMWSSGANMPKAASSFSAEMVNGKIYIIGEFLNPRVLTNVKEYDPVSDTWTTKAQLPEIFYAHGSCVYNGLIYSFGGRDVNFNLINTVRSYDPLTDTWNKLSDMPYKRDNPAVCVYHDEIYLFGGNPSLKYTPSTNTWTELDAGECEILAYATPIIDGNRIILFGGYKEGSYPVASNEIWGYYPDSDSFVRYPLDMPFDRFTEGYKYNNYVYLFGGHFSNRMGSVTGEVWRFDLSNIASIEPAWMQMKSMDIAKGGSRSCVIDDKIYVFGGTSSIGGTLSSAEVYNTGTNNWSELTPVPVDLDYTNVGVIDGKIYLAGGWHQPGSGWVTLNTTYAYDPITDSWETKKECPKKSGDNASCVLNGKLYLFGGLKDFPYNDASGQKDALVYDPETDTWDTLADMIYGRADGATAWVHDGQIYVFGGLSAISANESQIIGKTEKYDPEENTWTELADMPVPMLYHISLEYEGKLYVFGGDSTFNPNVNPAVDICTNFIQEYNPLTNEWRLMEGMPFNRGDMTGQKVGDFAYIIGGYPENARDFSSALSEVWRFDLRKLSPMVYPTGINLDKKILQLEIGDKDTLIATVLPDNVSNADVIWSTSNSEYVTVDNGIVTAIAVGSAEIYVATFDGNYRDTCKIDIITGINNKIMANFRVYPNPANDILHIKVPAQFKDEFEVKMFTITGKMILQKIGYIEQIDISGIPSGIYLISVQSKDFVSTNKIIKQ